MTDISIPTQTVPAPIEDVRQAVYRVLDGALEDVDVTLALSEALLVIEDVHPPYAPAAFGGGVLPLIEGLGAARAALEVAVQQADTVQDAVRLARASRCLPTTAAQEWQ